MRILVADDEKEIRKILRLVLEKAAVALIARLYGKRRRGKRLLFWYEIPADGYNTAIRRR